MCTLAENWSQRRRAGKYKREGLIFPAGSNKAYLNVGDQEPVDRERDVGVEGVEVWRGPAAASAPQAWAPHSSAGYVETAAVGSTMASMPATAAVAFSSEV